jgi:hypothetical protein
MESAGRLLAGILEYVLFKKFGKPVIHALKLKKMVQVRLDSSLTWNLRLSQLCAFMNDQDSLDKIDTKRLYYFRDVPDEDKNRMLSRIDDYLLNFKIDLTPGNKELKGKKKGMKAFSVTIQEAFNWRDDISSESEHFDFIVFSLKYEKVYHYRHRVISK